MRTETSDNSSEQIKIEDTVLEDIIKTNLKELGCRMIHLAVGSSDRLKITLLWTCNVAYYSVFIVQTLITQTNKDTVAMENPNIVYYQYFQHVLIFEGSCSRGHIKCREKHV